jgi:hypothetical protein
LSALIGDADLDQGTTSALQLTVDTLGPAIMAGLGSIDLDDIDTAEVVLVTLLVDDSGSMGGNENLVCDGHNLLMDALKASKQSASVLVGCRYLNSGVQYPYMMLDSVAKLDRSTYFVHGATPLHDMSATTLTGVVAKMTEFENGGVAARAITVIVSDGGDNNSRRHTAGTVKTMVSGLLATEQHIIAGMGIDDGYTDFRQVFSDMGIRDEWILTPGNSASEIRRAFQVVSQSAVRASQTAGSFSQVALGGFGN